MKLIIGGSFQGKSAYAAEYCSPSPIVADGSICTQEEILHCDILDHLHLYIRRLLEQSVSEKRDCRTNLQSLQKQSFHVHCM